MGEETNVEESEFDTWAAKILAEISKKSSRRGVLSKIGRILLRIAGVVVLPLLPVNRIVSNLQAQGTCGEWLYCGMCGTQCGCCGGGWTACPTGCPGSGMWSCCCYDGDKGYIINYIDCCEQGTACASCNGCPACANNCTGQEWCGQGRYTYRCTIVQRTLTPC
jgi:hypothetical protein